MCTCSARAAHEPHHRRCPEHNAHPALTCHRAQRARQAQRQRHAQAHCCHNLLASRPPRIRASGAAQQRAQAVGRNHQVCRAREEEVRVQHRRQGCARARPQLGMHLRRKACMLGAGLSCLPDEAAGCATCSVQPICQRQGRSTRSPAAEAVCAPKADMWSWQGWTHQAGIGGGRGFLGIRAQHAERGGLHSSYCHCKLQRTAGGGVGASAG